MAEIPRFEPTIRIPSARGIRFADPPPIGEALVNLGGSMQKVAEVEARKQRARDTNAAHTILNEAELGVEEDMVGLRREGVESGVFRTRGGEAIQKRSQAATEQIGRLADAQVRQYATGQLGTSMHRRTLGLVDETDKRFIDEDRATTVARREDLKNLAINASDDVGYAIFAGRLKDLLLGKAGNTMTREAAETAILKDAQEIAVERLKVQVKQYPESVDAILEGAAGVKLEEHEKESIREFSDTVVARRVERDNRLLAAAKRQFAAQAENVELEVSEAARKKTITKDGIADIARRYKGPDGAPIFTAERVATLQKRLDDARKFESDDATMKRLGLAIQTATSESELSSLLAQVDSAYRADLINEGDWDKLSARTRAYTAHFRDAVKSSYKTAHDQVMDEMKAMFRITPFMQSKMFDERSQAYEVTLRELNKESVLRGGNLDPRVWWEQNRYRVAARVRDVLDKQIDIRMQDLPIQYRSTWQAGKTPDQIQIDNAVILLNMKRPSMPHEEFEQHRRTILDVRRLVHEHNRAFGLAQQKSIQPVNPLGR